jgi:hypothetical protein
VAIKCIDGIDSAMGTEVKYFNQAQEPAPCINLACHATGSVSDDIYADRLGVGTLLVTSNGRGDRSKAWL